MKRIYTEIRIHHESVEEKKHFERLFEAKMKAAGFDSRAEFIRAIIKNPKENGKMENEIINAILASANDGIEIYTMSAQDFAELNDIEVNEIQYFSDSCTGAKELNPDTELKIIIEDGQIRVSRSDNPWNEPVEVIHGEVQNWNYKK